MSKLTIKELVVAYPSGNTTAVVFDDMSGVDRSKLNASILNNWSVQYPDKPAIEQCCFVSKASNSNAIGRLEMFGGEFCGNATRSVVWLLTKGKNGSGFIETSGYDKPLSYSVDDGIVTLEMPDASTSQYEQCTEVRFDGITWLVVPFKPTQVSLLGLLKNSSRLSSRAAVGLSQYDPATKQARFVVWVKEVDTVFDETSSGSGTAAIGIALAAQARKNQELDVVQPSGELIKVSVKVDSNGTPINTKISGKVKVLFNGKIELV